MEKVPALFFPRYLSQRSINVKTHRAERNTRRNIGGTDVYSIRLVGLLEVGTRKRMSR